ncbi:MAG TPA: helix-turn-helix domain-containing protein [Tepidisphaeraceae bacterium]|nr:helix-turn-helix domain-containing protein [Tepidisphaeraceae bacterium]
MLNSFQLGKLQSATLLATDDLRLRMSQTVANCPKMSPDARNGKTNPPTPPNKAKPLAPRQLAAAALLLSGATVSNTAQQLGIDRRTILRWKKDPRFQSEVFRQADRLVPVRAANRKTMI